MTWAADAAGHPSPQALKDSDCLFIGQYVGTQYQAYGVSRGYIDQCLGIGLGVMLIFEEWASQFLSGYDVARQMMDRMHASWNSLGVPDDGSVCPAIALVDPNPGAVNGNEDALRAFARGVNDGCWLPWFSGYGNKYGLDIAGEVAPKMQRRWGVGTWGYGERSDGSLPDWVSTAADLIQHGNRHAPVGGCDYNTIFNPNMGQWGGPEATTPEEKVNSSMDALYCELPNNQSRIVIKTGDYVFLDLTSAAGAYGLPIDALNYVGFDLAGVTTKFTTEEIVQNCKEISDRALNPPSSSGGGGGSTTPDDITSHTDAELISEVNKRIAAGQIDIDSVLSDT